MKINRFFMIGQAAFCKLTGFFVDYLLKSDFFEKKSSKRSKSLYRELLNMSLENQVTILVLNYKDLKNKLGYEYDNTRRALLELEEATLITKTQIPNSANFYIELNPEYWIDNKKKFMKELFDDTRSLLGEINERIGFEHEAHCHELMGTIMTSLDELELILEG